MSVSLLIKSKNGYPIAVINGVSSTSPISVHREYRSRIKRCDEGVIVPIDYWFRFVDTNKERFGLNNVNDIPVDKNSINYYGFVLSPGNVMYRTNLTENAIDKFFNYDGFRIVRYIPNTDETTNILGMRLAEFESIIYDSDYSQVVIGDDATVEECEAIKKGCHPESLTTKLLNAHIESLSLSETDIDSTLQSVSEYEQTINEIFDKYKDEIEEFKSTLAVHPLDCGFTVVSTNDDEMVKKYQHLHSLGYRNNCNVQCNFPDDYFNCSHSYAILNYVKTISKSDILNGLYVSTILD